MRFVQDYDRTAAVLYAHEWAYGRNPRFYDYENLGGDCTNFTSQCIFAGCGVMNFTPTFGWYYIDSDQKAPSWTGVPYLWNFLVRKGVSIGPVGQPCALEDLRPGDLIQLSFKGEEFQHTPIVVSVGTPVTPETVRLAAHSYDADNRPLSTYEYRKSRFLHITGTMRP
ncbi:amidase domain-containing protein [Oscillibacter sp.]|uniref:amidase domain-containing protein n=1 Tax=Oscillibacter sp. TaxID=1945593 RepID=UPI0026376706|nr:amidase domain-containing protein [Oscillibacter sp.]MDD3346275.1 amidase domain-containing protein [Oscillibacter sp.]